jgi:hypothetical protein
MPGNEKVGVDFPQERVDVFRTGISPPDESVDCTARAKILLLMLILFEYVPLEAIHARCRGQTMAYEDAICRSHREGNDAEQFQVTGVDAPGIGPVGLGNALAERSIQIRVDLGYVMEFDLGQLVISKDQMNLPWILAFKRRDEIDKLMGLVSAAGIAIGAVYQLLQNEMSIWIAAKLGLLQCQPEILDVSMEVAEHYDLLGKIGIHNPSAPSRRVAKGLHGPFEGAQKSSRFRHDSLSAEMKIKNYKLKIGNLRRGNLALPEFNL